MSKDPRPIPSAQNILTMPISPLEGQISRFNKDRREDGKTRFKSLIKLMYVHLPKSLQGDMVMERL
jgi:hypothetical protein